MQNLALFRWVGLLPFWSRATLHAAFKERIHEANACGVAVVRDCMVWCSCGHSSKATRCRRSHPQNPRVCRSQRGGRPMSGTVLRCRDKPFPAKGAAAVGHSFAVSRQAVPSEGGGRCRAQFCVCRDKPFPAKGAAAVGHSSAVSRQGRSQRRRRPLSGTKVSARAPSANGGVRRLAHVYAVPAVAMASVQAVYAGPAPVGNGTTNEVLSGLEALTDDFEALSSALAVGAPCVG